MQMIRGGTGTNRKPRLRKSHKTRSVWWRRMCNRVVAEQEGELEIKMYLMRVFFQERNQIGQRGVWAEIAMN